MYKSIYVICLKISFIVTMFNFFACSNGYKKIPDRFDDPDNLIKMVHPDKDYTYWQFCKWPAEKDSVIFSSGKNPANIRFDPPYGGLFTGCMPAMCYKYISYVYKGKIGYVNTPEQLEQFLGRIDNLEEALLLARSAEDLDIDNDEKKGGSYFIEKNGYHLLLMHYKSCPQTKESIFLRIEKDSGIVQQVNLGAYFKNKNCIVY